MKLFPWLCISIVALGQGPRLLLNEYDLGRINDLIGRESWAAQIRADLDAAASAWPQSHLDKYGLKEMALPPEGGQWGQWYVCPQHGVSLRYRAPNTHQCPLDNKAFTGWPFDQVIYARRLEDLGNMSRDLALSYRLTGKADHAQKSAAILRLIASRYLGYPYHDKDRGTARSGGRVLSQTLDESIWLISVAWAYDLLAGTDYLTTEDRDSIERNLLRPAVITIERNDAGESNWQTWHNTAIAAVGFALGDSTLVTKAIDGKSGFRFQMAHSVLTEGQWYEGSWGYHFYSLDALTQMAEMAARNGIDLWQDRNLRQMFELPLRLSFADGTLPAFNDSNTLNLVSYDRLYEVAYRRWSDPLLASWLGKRTRGRNALFWGETALPDVSVAPLASEVFPESGYASLRSASNDHALILKFGPHGGWHGHYDKLGFISFGLGGILGLDPGTQSYAAPTHDSWDKVTLAHNTVVVDEKSQGEATGKLRWTSGDERFSAVSAEAGKVYANAKLVRTMILTADYTLDVFDVESTDGAEHRFDWIYHNRGTTKTDQPLVGPVDLPSTHGYQHLKGSTAAKTGNDWQLTFDGSNELPSSYGSVYASVAQVSGGFGYTGEQVGNGRLSGKITYRLDGPGYLLFTTPALVNQPRTAPIGLTMMIYGDNSGHRLTLRLNDATDERFTVLVGPLDWTGWKMVEVANPAEWSHYLGNNDGIIDLPVRNASLQLDRVAGGPANGTLYVDDITFVYPDSPRVAADFEYPLRHLRLWMLGEPDTTVVAGEGPGPDLTKPVAYVMARRKSDRSSFVTILEPFSSQPKIQKLVRSGDGRIIVTGPDFEDAYTLTAEGITRDR